MNPPDHLMRNYRPPAIAAARGEGAWLFDTEGRRYLDFTSGIAVNALGHCHPDWVAAVAGQAARLVHCSNLFGIAEQQRLAARLVDRAGPGRVLFCNSGAEANEALLKLARLHGRRLSGGEEGRRFTVVTAENGFHGRTFGGMAATPQEKIQDGFRPMLEGFRSARFNDIAAFEAAVDETVAAVLVESIQGEGGIFCAEPAFLRELRALCDERGALLMIDEVQCGIARSGQFFAYQEAGIRPDAIGMAKGLGGGFPIGAVWTAEPFADLFTPGSHGSTFAGSPLACAAAHAVLDVIERDGLVERVRSLAADWHAELRALAARHPAAIEEVRGRGFMVALAVREDPAAVVERARDQGLLCVPAGNRAVRLLPPLTAGRPELDASLDRLARVFAKTG